MSPHLSVPELSCSHSRPDKFPNNLESDAGKKIHLRSVDTVMDVCMFVCCDQY